MIGGLTMKKSQSGSKPPVVEKLMRTNYQMMRFTLWLMGIILTDTQLSFLIPPCNHLWMADIGASGMTPFQSLTSTASSPRH